MTVKNVLKGLARQYDLEALRILTPTRVLFSGPVERWEATASEQPCMLPFKRQVEAMQVANRIMFHDEAFIFVDELPDIL